MAGQSKLLRCVVGSVASVRHRHRAFHLQNNHAKLGLQGLPWFCGARGLLSSREDSILSKPLFTFAGRAFSTSSKSQENNDEDASSLSSNQPVESPLGSEERMISVTFVDKHGDEKAIKVPLGLSMLEAAHQNGIELEGACEGSLACSTCHVIVMDEKYYNKLPEPSDEENDMLDLAFGLTETSRLGCQVLAKPELDGMRLAIPSATRNFAVDGYVPKPH